MISPLKRIIVFDLETGGLDWRRNPITEFAGVVIETENLTVIEEFSVMLRPRLDFTYMEESPVKEAKRLFKDLAEKDAETKVKSLKFKGETLTLKNLDSLVEEIEGFFEVFLYGNREQAFSYEEYLQMLDSDYKYIAELYMNHHYNPEAMEVTHMNIDLLLEEGVEASEAASQIQQLIERHTVGNNKPIVAGHNIIKFDIPYMERLFSDSAMNFLNIVNDYVMDSLDLVRLCWYELSAFNLGVSANELGLTLKEAHRALPDTRANAKLIVKLLKRLRGEGGQGSTYKRRKYNLNL